jgi:hypothetical protein
MLQMGKLNVNLTLSLGKSKIKNDSIIVEDF